MNSRDDRMYYNDRMNYEDRGYYDERRYHDERRYYDNRRYNKSKNQYAAAILSALITGTGQMYCAFGIKEWGAQFFKGLMYMAIAIFLWNVTLIMAFLEPASGVIGFVCCIGWWLVNIVDATRTAQDITNGCYSWSFMKLA